VSRKTKTKYVLFLFSFYFLSYFLIQSVITSGHNLLTSLDQLIPFVPEFIWIYHTLIPVFIITTMILIERKSVFYTAFFSVLLASIVMNLFYIYFPVTYPRDMWQLTEPSLSGFFVELTRRVDGANNAFPSGHVTLSCLLTLLIGLTNFAKRYNWLQPLYAVWAILIAASTLTLKQHFIVDVVSGIILALMCYLLMKFIVFKVLPEKRDLARIHKKRREL
jgi:membrane-associated phospholipid phosphatase